MANPIVPISDSMEAFEDPEKVYHEINLLRIEGHYFCFDRDRKNKKTAEKYSVTEEVKTPEGLVKKQITIEPAKEYGRPSVLAHKILQATVKKYSEYGLPFPEGVPFTYRELAKLAGRKSFGGANTKEFKKAIMQLRRTVVTCALYNKETKNWAQADFNIFSNVALTGEAQTIKHCFFWLDRFFVKSLNNRYAFCLNYRRMENLEPIGVVLFKRLFFYLSNIYSQGKRRDLIYTKDYADVCKHWLGGLKTKRYKAEIQRQLGQHFKTLKDSQLIKKVDIVKNEQGDGFNLVFYPGRGFFADYERFYGGALQFELPFRQKHEERYIAQPVMLVRYFYQSWFGKAEIDESILDAAEVELASLLLEEQAFEEIKAWIDYAIKQAKKTGFEMKKFGGIKNYKTEFFINQERERQKKTNEEKQKELETKEKERRAKEAVYRDYRTNKINEYKQTLGEAELQKIEAAVKAEEAEKTNPSQPWFGAIIKHALESRLAKLAQVPSLEEWLARESKLSNPT